MVPKASVTAVQPGAGGTEAVGQDQGGGIVAQHAGARGDETVDEGHVGQAAGAGPYGLHGVDGADEQYGGLRRRPRGARRPRRPAANPSIRARKGPKKAA